MSDPKKPAPKGEGEPSLPLVHGGGPPSSTGTRQPPPLLPRKAPGPPLARSGADAKPAGPPPSSSGDDRPPPSLSRPSVEAGGASARPQGPVLRPIGERNARPPSTAVARPSSASMSAAAAAEAKSAASTPPSVARLPAAKAKAPLPPPAPAAPPPLPPPKPVRERPGAKVILVVEDDPAVRTLLAHGLGTVYTVYVAMDGQAALELLARMPKPPDCIVSDVMMPRLDGLGLAKALRESGRLRYSPIIFLTAKDDPMAVVSGINAGARHYLAKPVNLQVLLEKVAKVVVGH